MAKSTTRSRQAAASARAVSRRRRRNLMWLWGLGSVTAIAVVVAVILSVAGGSGGTSPGSTTRSGDLAPDFSFTLYQGERDLGAETLDLSQLRGKPVVLNFWAGACPPCRAEMPDLQMFYEDSQDQVTLIGIDVGRFLNLGSKRDAENLLRELNITYAAGFTNDGGVVREYEVLGMPTTVFIDSKGEIFEKWTGILNRDILDSLTNAMLKKESRGRS